MPFHSPFKNTEYLAYNKGINQKSEGGRYYENKKNSCIGVISSDGSFRTVRLRKFQFQHNSRYKGESNASAESSTEPVVLHWWGSFAENMGPEQVCEAFNKIDPNLQVEYTRYVNDDAGNTKLDMTLMSDDSIDVFLNMNDVL